MSLLCDGDSSLRVWLHVPPKKKKKKEKIRIHASPSLPLWSSSSELPARLLSSLRSQIKLNLTALKLCGVFFSQSTQPWPPKTSIPNKVIFWGSRWIWTSGETRFNPLLYSFKSEMTYPRSYGCVCVCVLQCQQQERRGHCVDFRDHSAADKPSWIKINEPTLQEDNPENHVTNPKSLCFEVKGFSFSLPGLPAISKSWLKS